MAIVDCIYDISQPACTCITTQIASDRYGPVIRGNFGTRTKGLKGRVREKKVYVCVEGRKGCETRILF